MARRRGRKGGRRYGRRFAKGARRALSAGPRLFGFRKDGFHASDAVIVGSALIAPFIPAYGNNSAFDYLSGKADPTLSLGKRIATAGCCLSYVGLGYNPSGISGSTSTNSATKGIAGMGVIAGCALKMASRFVNPWMRQSAVKL